MYAAREENKRNEMTNMYGDQEEKGGTGEETPKIDTSLAESGC